MVSCGLHDWLNDCLARKAGVAVAAMPLRLQTGYLSSTPLVDVVIGDDASHRAGRKIDRPSSTPMQPRWDTSLVLSSGVACSRDVDKWIDQFSLDRATVRQRPELKPLDLEQQPVLLVQRVDYHCHPPSRGKAAASANAGSATQSEGPK